MVKYRVGEFIELYFEPREDIVAKLNKDVIPNVLETLWTSLEKKLPSNIFRKIVIEFDENRRKLSEFLNPGCYKGKKHLVYANAVDVDLEGEVPEIDSKDLEANVDVTIGNTKAKIRAYLFLGPIEE